MISRNGVLQQEFRLFEQYKQKWLQLHAGEFALISNTTIAGFYPDYESAFLVGLQNFGSRDFLIKQVLAEEPVHFIY